MTARTLTAAVLGTLALSATPALAGETFDDRQVRSIYEASDERGWPHKPSAREIRDLTASVRSELAQWIGIAPDRGRCSFRACSFAWEAGATARVALTVYEDGSYRYRSVVAGGGPYNP